MLSMRTPTLVWNAEEYHDLSIAQIQAADNFLGRMTIPSDANILDIGCGNGRTTAKLASAAFRGHVTGIDKSEEMISFAKSAFSEQHITNMQFYVKDALELHCEDTFSILFSSYMLQWIKDKNLFLRNAYALLKPSGTLNLITPLEVSLELETAISFAISHPQWAKYYSEFHPDWHFVGAPVIKHLVGENLFQIQYSHQYVQEVEFESQEAFEKYVLLWFPYLAPLPPNKQPAFFRHVMNEYYRLLPPTTDGRVTLRIPQLDLIAKKS